MVFCQGFISHRDRRQLFFNAIETSWMMRAESEVEAYRAEKKFLESKAGELEKKCKRIATATTPNGITYTAKRCEPSPWGTWTLSVSGAMAGQGTLTVSEGGGNWSADTTVSGP